MTLPSRSQRPPVQIEPGLIYVFRLFLTIQWALLSLALFGIVSKPVPIPDYQSILSKLEVSDRAQATAIAWRYGLANLGDDAS